MDLLTKASGDHERLTRAFLQALNEWQEALKQWDDSWTPDRFKERVAEIMDGHATV